jgi:hypothetical protein
MNYLSFDKRALALMRICIAFVLMLDLGIRMTDLEAFYSNTGVLPLPALFEHAWNPYFISIHTISGLWQVQLILFLIAFFFAILLFIGYRTQLFTFLSWFMLLSLHNRNVMILQGGDDLLRMVLFWSIFIPWGDRYSCDRLLNPELQQNNKTNIFTVATIAYLLQVCYIYTGSALLKGPEWNHDFTALYYAYSLDQIAYPVTKHIYYFPELLKNLTRIAYYFELLVPLLFFIPVKHSWLRTTGVFAIIIFHLINGMTLFIGLFPLIGIATVIGILPSSFMNGFDRRIKKIKPVITRSFCGLASGLQLFVRWKKFSPLKSILLQRTKTAILIFLIFFVFDWNFSNLTFINSKLSDDLRIIGYGLRLDQNWGMFAPNVFKDDGWFILEGITTSGKDFDLLHPDQPLSFSKPANIVSMFKNDRWRKYSENYIFADNEFLRGYFCNYCKRIWNEKHPDQYVTTLSVIYMSEFSLPDYKYSQPVKNVMWECVDEK